MSKETEIAVLTEDKEILSTFKKVEKTNENGKLVDLENCYVTEEREEIDSSAILENMLSVKNFGTYFCIGDYDFVLKFREILFAYFDKNENCHAVIKVHIVENVPLLLFFSITFLQLKKPVVKEKLKFNFIQNLSDGVSKPREVKLKNLEKTFAYVRDTCAYQLLFQNFNPGTVNKFRYREKLWSDKTDLTISVIDTDDKELIELKRTTCLIVTKDFVKDFSYSRPHHFLELCKQLQSSRVLLVKPNFFCNYTIEGLKEVLKGILPFLKFADCVDEQIKLNLVNDRSTEKTTIQKVNDYQIIDCIDHLKEVYRQILLVKETNYKILSEVKLKLVGKSKIKEGNNTQVHTTERYEKKNIVLCIDPTKIISEFVQSAIVSSVLSKSSFPEEPLKVLIVGAGVGVTDFFLKHVFGNKVEVVNLEEDKALEEVRVDYFGFKTGSKWKYCDSVDYLRNNKKKFDCIINESVCVDRKEGVSPSTRLLSKEVIYFINESLSEEGTFIVDLCAYSQSTYLNHLKEIKVGK